MTSGEFFREPDHCEFLAQGLLPSLSRPRRRPVQLWSAGCASGEAAWSLAMLVDEADLPPQLAVRIVASERDPKLLARAGDAVYTDAQLDGVPDARRRRHFVRGVGPRDGLWRVVAPLRDRVELVELDLRGPWPVLGPFDVVWCNGAFAELDRPAAARLARRFAEVLAPGGVMLLGASAFVASDAPELEPCGHARFRRPPR